jgi:UDP-N-acetylmuramoyl-tripeptide--D-alanyl-D-alanine ligase
MLELGLESASLHEACGKRMAEKGVTTILGVRGAACSLVEGALRGGGDAIFVATPEDAGKWMRSNLRSGDVVLLKASRGVRLEKSLAELQD